MRELGPRPDPLPRLSPWRRLPERLFRTATALCAFGGAVVLGGLVTVILWQGLAALDWSFVASGEGILFQMLGTLLLIVTALVIATPTAVAISLCATVYAGSRSVRSGLVNALFLLNGVPSIVFGIVGLAFFVRFLGWGKSWLAGGILLALMILPTLAVAVIERLEAIPAAYPRAARGLGLSRARVVWSVYLPQSAGGLLSGSFLGLARAAGETAPIMFVAAVFSGVGLPTGVRESPVLALPYHVFVLAQDTFSAEARAELWAAAFVLVALVLALSLASLPWRLRAHEEARHG